MVAEPVPDAGSGAAARISERMLSVAYEAPVPDEVFADFAVLVGAAFRFGRILERGPGEVAPRVAAKFANNTAGLKQMRDRFEHQDEWLAGIGHRRPSKAGRHPHNGQLIGVEIVRSRDGRTLAFEMVEAQDHNYRLAVGQRADAVERAMDAMFGRRSWDEP